MAKYKIIPSSRTIVQSPISIGHKAEKGVEAIEFDLTAWVETYGSGTATIVMKRWGDAIPYPIALEIDENNKATWTLSDIDTAKAGMAYAQLNYIVGDEVVKKSDIYTFRVMDSLTGEGEPPEAYESWLEHLTHLAAEAMAEVLDIEGIVTDKTLTVDGGIADAKATGDALSALEDAMNDEVSAIKADLDAVTGGTYRLDFVSGYTPITGIITNNSVFRVDGQNDLAAEFSASGLTQIQVTASAGKKSVVSLLKSSASALANGSVPNFCSGITAPISVDAGQTTTINIPEDCKYILFTLKAGGTSGYAPATVTATTVGVESAVKTEITDIVKADQDKESGETVITGTSFAWEIGSIGTAVHTAGMNVDNVANIRTMGYIEVPEWAKTYEFSGVLIGSNEVKRLGYIFEYTESGVFIGRKTVVGEDAVSFSNTCKYIRLSYGYALSSGIVLSTADIPAMAADYTASMTDGVDKYYKLLSGLGFIDFNVKKGIWTSGGDVNTNTVGIMMDGLLPVTPGQTINVRINGDWAYTVWQGNATNALTKTHRIVKHDSVETTERYIGFCFYKLVNGSTVDIQPGEFKNAVMLFMSGTEKPLIHDMPENIGVLNIVRRAYQMAKLRYTPVANLPTQVNTSQYPGYIPAGTEITGVIYSSVRNEGLYVPQCVSFHSYMTALLNPNSYIYTKTEPSPHYNALTYYGAVCSSLVAYCYGIDDVIPTTVSYDTYEGMETLEHQSPYWLKIADALIRSDVHIAIVTDIARTKRGLIEYIEVTDQVNYAATPKTRIRQLTVSEVQTEYFNGGYIAYRYRDAYKVPYAPTPWINLDDESDAPVYNANLSPRRGDMANWIVGEDIVIDVLDDGGYTNVQLYKGDTLISTTSIPSNGVITYSDLAYGQYKVRLSKDSTYSDYVYFNIIDTTVEYDTSVSGQLTVSYSSHMGTASSICLCEANANDSDYRAVRSFHVLTDAEVEAGHATLTVSGTWLAKVMFKTEYGLYSSDLTQVTIS